MARARSLPLLLALSLLASAFSAPTGMLRPKREFVDNELDTTEVTMPLNDLIVASSENRITRQDDESQENTLAETDTLPPVTEDEPSRLDLSPTTESTITNSPEYASPEPVDNEDDDDDDDFDEPMAVAPTTGGGSNIFSLLRLANALFPGSSGGNASLFLRRHDVAANEIEGDTDLKPPPLQRQEIEENESENSESESSQEDESEEEYDDNAAEESIEDDVENISDVKKSKQDSAANGAKDSASNDSDDDSDEPPEGDGQGGGILGILAGLSGGEDGQSDLGSLLATVSGIVANLSGDGIDINALIASGLGLFVGLLSEGEENPGAVIASYLLTSLESLTGGGSNNNGAFFGAFLSKLIKGTSAGIDSEASSEENAMPMNDSSGFFLSFLMGLLGDMSKGSSGGSSHPSERAYLTRRNS